LNVGGIYLYRQVTELEVPMYNPIFERDLLYPTDNLLEPGSVRVSVLKPETDGRLPLFITPKSDHDPMDYFDTIVDIIKTDIFDRIHIDIKSYGIFYIDKGNSNYIRLVYRNGKPLVEQ